MTAPATYLFDLLKGRKLSSFVIIEDTSLTASSIIWSALCKQLCDRYTCLVVRTELPGSPFPSFPSSIKQISLFDYANGIACIEAVQAITATKPPDGRQFVVVFESLDGLLLECVSDHQFGPSIKELVVNFTLIATSQFTASLVCSINVYKNHSGEITWASEELCKTFEDCAATCLKLTPSSTTMNQIDAQFWHRRTKDSIYRSVRQPDLSAPSNKPTISAECRLTVDHESRNVLSCVLCNPKGNPIAVITGETLPSSTFKLSLSQKEIEDRQRVVLPYKAVGNGNVNAGWGSNIEYDADKFDDIDDDDPDDDLEI